MKQRVDAPFETHATEKKIFEVLLHCPLHHSSYSATHQRLMSWLLMRKNSTSRSEALRTDKIKIRG